MKHKRKHIHSKIKALKKKKKFFQQPLFWIFLLLAILIGGALYLVLWLPAVQVSKVTIFGNQSVGSAELQFIMRQNVVKKIGFSFLHVNSSSIFLTDTKKIEHDLGAQFAGIETVKVSKIWFNGLSVTVKERSPIAVFCDNGNPQQCFNIDGNGVIFGSLPGAFVGGVVFVQPAGAKQALAGDEVVSQNIVAAVLQIQKNLQDNFQIGLTQALIDNPLVVSTLENWKIYFDPAGDMGLQTTKLSALLTSQITPKTRKSLQYIYLQYGDKAYYK